MCRLGERPDAHHEREDDRAESGSRIDEKPTNVLVLKDLPDSQPDDEGRDDADA